MPLDKFLNPDVKRAHDRHIAVTLHLPMENDRKLYNCTPWLISHDIKQIVESTGIDCSSSERITNDYDKVFDATGTVYNSDGAIIPGLADRNGQRYSTAETGNHGGWRVINEVDVDMSWLDIGAREAMLEKQLGIVDI